MLQDALQKKAQAGVLVPDTKTTVTMDVGRPPFFANDAGRALLLVPMTGGATDAAFACCSGRAAVVESFGLAGFGYHACDEYVEIARSCRGCS